MKIKQALIVVFALIWLTMRDVWAILWDYARRRRAEQAKKRPPTPNVN